MFAAARVRPTDRWVLITGCDSGFGLEVAQRLLRDGFGVIAGCLTELGCERLRRLAEGAARLSVVRCDVTREEDLAALVTEAERRCGGDLWALVNNAGIAIPGHVDYQSIDNYHKVMQVNYFAPVDLTSRCMPMLKQARGRVINITSTCGIVAVPTNAPYNSAKFALEAYSDTLRRENRGWGVEVSIVEPGCMKTAISSGYYDALRQTYQDAPSEARQEYGDAFIEDVIRTGVKGMSSLAQDPQKAIDAICHAVTAKKPRHRYLPGVDAKLLFFPMSLMPSTLVDPMLRLSTGSARPEAMQDRGAHRYEFSRVINAPVEETYMGWLQYAWKEGCRMLTPPVLQDEGDEHGTGCNREVHMVGDLHIVEGITNTDFPHKVGYQVMNPSWYTFPVHFHRGEVRFHPCEGGTEVIWRVDVTPMRFGRPVVWSMLHLIIPLYLKRLSEHLQEQPHRSSRLRWLKSHAVIAG